MQAMKRDEKPHVHDVADETAASPVQDSVGWWRVMGLSEARAWLHCNMAVSLSSSLLGIIQR